MKRIGIILLQLLASGGAAFSMSFTVRKSEHTLLMLCDIRISDG